MLLSPVARASIIFFVLLNRFIYKKATAFERRSSRVPLSGKETAELLCPQAILSIGRRSLFAPFENKIELSYSVYFGKTAGAMATAAHEAGHALLGSNKWNIRALRTFTSPLNEIALLLFIVLPPSPFHLLLCGLFFMAFLGGCAVMREEWRASKLGVKELLRHVPLSEKALTDMQISLRLNFASYVTISLTFFTAFFSSLIEYLRWVP